MPAAHWPVLSIIHNDNTLKPWYWSHLLRWQHHILGYVAVSNTIRHKLVHEFNVAPERVWAIPCGITMPSVSPPDKHSPRQEGRLFLLYAGRISAAQKRVDDLVGLVEHLNQSDEFEHLTVELHIAGEGPEEQPLKEQLESMPGRTQVIFHGRIARDELFKLYAQAHIFLLLSAYEGMPIALREAMAHGVVPVVTDIPANRELVEPGTNGFVFPVGDVAACAARCVQVALSDAYQQMSALARQQMQGHSTAESARQYAALIRQLAEGSA
jgi:glycosyltransferase involved in cell wall biosynthesis